MTFLKFSLVVFSVLSISIFSLSIPNVMAGGTVGCWECSKGNDGHTVCVGMGKGIEQDIANLKTEFQKLKAQKKTTCTFTCEKKCWTEHGVRHCNEVCRGNGPECDRFLNEMLSPR